MRYLILYLLILALPFQTRILLKSGLDEYSSFFLYGTDILVGIFFIVWFLQGETSYFSKKRFLPLFFLILWFFIASLFSADTSLGLYKTIKITEYIALFFSLISLPKTVYGNARACVIASGVFQSIVAIWQFIGQHSIGLRLLGENTLAPDIAGVAKLDIWGEKVMRAYGTFPHPNALAAFLLFCLFLTFISFAKEKHFLSNRFFIFIIPIITLGLLLTFSRAVIFIGVIAILCWFICAKIRPWRAGGIFLCSLTVFSLLLFPYLAGRFSFNLKDQAVSLRLLYTQNAFSFIKEHPFLGVGPSQFTLAQQKIIATRNLLAWANQPVHNIYLLLASEVGVPGLVLFFWFLYEYARLLWRKNKRIFFLRLIPPLAILCIGLFDHFFFTYQQGMLLFWSSLAFFYETRR